MGALQDAAAKTGAELDVIRLILLAAILAGCATAPLRPHAAGECRPDDVLHRHVGRADSATTAHGFWK